MKVYHIAHVRKTNYAGVSVVVPQHLIHQSKYCDIVFFNLSNRIVDGINCQFLLRKKTEFVSWLDRDKPDIVVFHEIYYPLYLDIYKELIKRNIKYVIVPHGSLSKRAQSTKPIKKFIANFFFFNSFISHAAGIQCLSLDEKNNLTKKGNLFIGTNGVEMPEIRKSSFSADGLLFLYIGRLDPYIKGIDILLTAINIDKVFLREKNCHFKLRGPASDCWEKEIVRMIENYGISDLVTLDGPIVGLEKESELLKADYFIQTSRTEGMPLGIIEAFSYGLPCVVTDGTNVANIVEKYDAGITSKTDFGSLSKVLVQAANEINRLPERSRNAILLAKTNFDWDVISRSTVSVYEKIAKEV